MNEMTNQDLEKTAIGTMDMDRTQAVATPQGEATQYGASVTCPVCQTANPPSERYCIDCGFMLSEEPVEVGEAPEVNPEGKLISSDGTREFPLRTGENTVGRENTDVLLNDSTVSRRHALITVQQDGKASIEDLGSTNGTVINGKRLSSDETVELNDGDEVAFGSVRLKYEAPELVIESEEAAEEVDIEKTQAIQVEPDGEPVESEPVSESNVVEQMDMSELVVVAKLIAKSGDLSFDLTEGVHKVGRRASNDFIIPDPYSSGYHADITVEDGKISITDVGSTNGTSVNGVPLEANVPKKVSAGDEIMVGQTKFTIEEI